MEINFDYEPLPIHHDFHSSSAREKIMFGAVGSGKSYALCSECIARCLETPGLRALLARKYASNLRDTTETVFFDILPGELYKAGKPTRVGGHYESFLFPRFYSVESKNGSSTRASTSDGPVTTRPTNSTPTF